MEENSERKYTVEHQLATVYRKVTRVPTILSARIVALEDPFPECETALPRMLIHSKCSQRSLEKGKMVHFNQVHYFEPYNLNSSTQLPSVKPVDCTNELLSQSSPSDKLLCIIRELSESDNSKKQYLEFWDNDHCVETIDLTLLNNFKWGHGEVYNDSEFGCLEWSPDETMVAYIAERRKSQWEPYYPRREKTFEEKFVEKAAEQCKIQLPQSTSSTPDQDDIAFDMAQREPRVGSEYRYFDHWGEQLQNRVRPVIVVWRRGMHPLPSVIRVYELDRYHDVERDGDDTCDDSNDSMKIFSPGQLVWSLDNKFLYGVGFYMYPRKLGLAYCTNRVSCIFKLNLETRSREILSEAQYSVKSPRLHPSGNKLIWLQRPRDGPHDTCHQLVEYNFITKTRRILIDTKNCINDINDFDNSEVYFRGIYTHHLPRRCFSQDGNAIVFDTVNRNKQIGYIYLDQPIKRGGPQGLVHFINVAEHSVFIHDVFMDCILASASAPNIVPHLRMFTLEGELLRVITPPHLAYDVNIVITRGVLQSDNDFDGHRKGELRSPCDANKFNYILLMPDRNQRMLSKKIKDEVPLVVYPHGGPHSAFVLSYMIEPAYFVSMGFAVCMVNYRGSTGAGADYVESLLGRIGLIDVEDVHAATMHLVSTNKRINKNAVLIYGGSFGGFIGAHLCAQFPNIYSGAVLRNPVIDLPAMFTATDIPDWCIVEAARSEQRKKNIRFAEEDMRNASPTTYEFPGKVPTLILIGKNDLRVPPSQGMHHYFNLRQMNIKCRLNVYDDNHALSKVPVHLDALNNAGMWFLRVLNESN